MAQEPSAPNESSQAKSQSSATPAPKGAFGIIKIGFIVVQVILLECVVAYMYLPSASVTAALASSAVEHKDEKATEADKKLEDEKNSQVEVDLGQFNVTNYRPTSNTTLRIDFHLYGTVTNANQKEFTTRLEENLHRFRDQVLVTVRSSEITDLTDAGLGLMKRTIMDKTNRMIGKPLLESVIFSDFSFIEQ